MSILRKTEDIFKPAGEKELLSRFRVNKKELPGASSRVSFEPMDLPSYGKGFKGWRVTKDGNYVGLIVRHLDGKYTYTDDEARKFDSLKDAKDWAAYSSQRIYEDIFKPATAGDIETRKRERMETIKQQNAALYRRFENIGRLAGFVGPEVVGDPDENTAMYTVRKGDDIPNYEYILRLQVHTQWSPNRLKVAVYDRKNWEKLHLSLGLKDETIAQKIKEILLPRFEPGDVGWKATYLPKARYKKPCAICGTPIKSGEEHLRLRSGQTVCRNCVKKGALLLKVEEILKWAY